MKRIKIYAVLALGFLSVSFSGQEPDNKYCGIRNTTFIAGEEITYSVFYSLAGIYVNAGITTFTCKLDKIDNRPVYHVVGEGRTLPSFDWIYKVRDKYESFIDTATLKPLKFIRNIQEGEFKKYENIIFNHNTKTAISTEGVFQVPGCVQDVLSAIYYARNIDFNKYNPGDKIPFFMFLDNEVFEMFIRYLGKETIKTRYGTFNTIKFKPLLLKGTIFKGGEKMQVWVTDDENRIPVRIKSPIIVGSIKADMMSYKNLRYPLTALQKLRGN